MEELRLQIKNLSHSFSNKYIFKKINVDVMHDLPLSITGRNGSGKSTLLKIISGLLIPRSGSIKFSSGDREISLKKKLNLVGMFAPYINLYDEMTGEENLSFFLQLKGITGVKSKADFLLDKVGLPLSSSKLFKNYSSGMKQRLRLAFAVCNNPKILIMDEPSSNLDNEGFEIVRNAMTEQIERGLLIVASNDNRDLELCRQNINIEKFKE